MPITEDDGFEFERGRIRARIDLMLRVMAITAPIGIAGALLLWAVVWYFWLRHIL